MRVGVLALLQESNTFLAGVTTLDHFRADVLAVDEEVRDRFAGTHHEVGGFFEGLERERIEAVPIFATRAVPYGRITSDAFAELMRLMSDALDRAGPLDGLLVAPHGATVAESHPDADGHWLSLVRSRYPRLPIIGTLDPHANLSPAMVAATDALIAYRSNPHLDQKERGLEAAALMARTLRGEVKPTQAASFPPLIINIERQHTAESPCRDEIEYADRMRSRDGVLSNSLILGFPYADVPEMGSAALVVTNNDPGLARRLADEWSRRLWDRREEFVGRLISVDDAIVLAARLDGPVGLLDMGDNVGGGSPGDGTILAWALRECGLTTFVCLYDPKGVQDAEAINKGWGKSRGMGLMHLGGRTDDRMGSPIQGEFWIMFTSDGRFEEPEPRHGGFRTFDQGRTVGVGGFDDDAINVMLTSRRVPPFSLRQLTAFGINPSGYQAIVIKGVHAPVAAYSAVCRHLIRVNTPGVTSADLSQFTFHHRRRPMFPFEPDATWDRS